jgi:large subunit ribosomal protein L4
LAAPKTKEFAAVINNLNLKGTKTTFVVDGADKNTQLSARNVPSVSLTAVNSLNIFEIMNCKKLVLSEAAVKAIESNFSNN